MNRVLACVPHPSIALMLRLTLHDEGFEVVTSDDCTAVEDDGFDAVIVDVEAWPLDEADPFELPDLCSRHPVVVISSGEPRPVRMETGADAALRKPFDGHVLAKVLRQLTRSY